MNSLGWQVTLIIIVTLLVYWLLTRFGKRILSTALTKKTVVLSHRSHTLSLDAKQRIETVSSVIIKTIRVCVLVVGLIVMLTQLGLDITPVLAGAGVLGVALGFGAQSLVKDILSGIFIIMEHQYVKGDVVQLGDVQGTVEHLSLRRTVLRDQDGIEHHIPNGTIIHASNLSKNWANLNLILPVAYSNNVDTVIETLEKVIQEFTTTSPWKDFLLSQLTVLGIDHFDDKGMLIKIDGRIDANQQWVVSRELRRRIKRAFDQAGLVFITK